MIIKRRGGRKEKKGYKKETGITATTVGLTRPTQLRGVEQIVSKTFGFAIFSASATGSDKKKKGRGRRRRRGRRQR